MTEIVRQCSTCAYWRSGAHISMEVPALDESHAQIGACENIVPQIFIINDQPETYQPTTHATRCCADWRSAWFDDEPGGGEPAPDPARVHRLFPIKPAPVAA